jgi:hypothetical protein
LAPLPIPALFFVLSRRKSFQNYENLHRNHFRSSLFLTVLFELHGRCFGPTGNIAGSAGAEPLGVAAVLQAGGRIVELAGAQQLHQAAQARLTRPPLRPLLTKRRRRKGLGGAVY